jgi:hypothetical protein
LAEQLSLRSSRVDCHEQTTQGQGEKIQPPNVEKIFKFVLANARRSSSIVSVREDYVTQNQKQIAASPLSESKLAFPLEGQRSKHAHSGVPKAFLPRHANA